MQKEYWAIIPAAGVGKRMQTSKPKQYLTLHNKTVIEHTLDRLLSMTEINGVVLSISEGDEYWPALNYKNDKPVLVAAGGKERSDSVLNALLLLQSKAQQTNNINPQSIYALVHDAARPCVRTFDIQNLIQQASDENGGLLALAVRDTMKRATADNSVTKTVERNYLWHALTPQMFKLDLLINALKSAKKSADESSLITDDSSAMEMAGYKPKLIAAHEDNIKITQPFDLKLAEIFLNNQS